ncbi:MAG: NB-ARC domain-containing protein [Proteobacteria bacterium]|nr:NB-ARC domain-containing protein [Pseudomonadota bacterium]
MVFLPFDRMWQRIEVDRQDSDTTLGLSLLYFGEMIIKTIALGLVAAIQDDRERSRYRQIYQLVRADGIGSWVHIIQEMLTGPISQKLSDSIKEERMELNSILASGWQRDAVSLMHQCIMEIDVNAENLPMKTNGIRCLHDFVKLRNATRGHGALHSETYSQICPALELALKKITDNFKLFQRPWAYLRRNLSGKYRVTKISQSASEFDEYKKSQSSAPSLEDGIYLWLDGAVKVDLIFSSADAVDFLYPNGKFSNKKFETISYVTNSKSSQSSSRYLQPVTPLPSSDTQGYTNLDLQGEVFGNLPPKQQGYIQRPILEDELKKTLLLKDQYPIVTLLGRGGIGKTWLTLSVLHEIATLKRYDFILWFSARDIDLLPEGPKIVAPHVLTIPEIAKEFTALLEPEGAGDKSFDPVNFLAETMTFSSQGSTLFVFDNFETVQSPIELFNWIDTYIRLPNKALITTRFREFKADYPIEVLGMREIESDELIETTAKKLGVDRLLTKKYKAELYQESNGHPYVMKVLLGEVSKAGKATHVERIVASREDILDALFERTFSGLSPAAKRIFFTLCSWRSSIPLLALEAVLLRPGNERIEVEKAVEELSRSSFVEINKSAEDHELFITMPLVTFIFGKRKLPTYTMKSAVDADIPLLHAFGAAQQSDINKGILPRIERLYKTIAERVVSKKTTIEENLSLLEFVARKVPYAWMLLAKLYRETDLENRDKAKECVRRYIETSPKNSNELRSAWRELAQLCSQTEDWAGEIHALVEICQLPDASFYEISDSVRRVNSIFKEYYEMDSEEKRVVSSRLAEIMENRIYDEGDATDCSRLAWLLVGLKDESKARDIVEFGLSQDPDNDYCNRLLNRLSPPRF